MAVEAMGMQIRIPQGDTGSVKFVCYNGEVLQDDRALFTVASRSGIPILRKVLSPDEKGEAFCLPFTFEETSKMKPDSYEWSLRVVSEGAFDSNGKMTGAKASHTPVLCGKLIILPVAGGAK
ncbi:MAG: hypothetical protein IJD60_07585 [Clostridia bacterium]|nr:hypothetical protein [Clostridia bacterium]